MGVSVCLCVANCSVLYLQPLNNARKSDVMKYFTQGPLGQLTIPEFDFVANIGMEIICCLPRLSLREID